MNVLDDSHIHLVLAIHPIHIVYIQILYAFIDSNIVSSFHRYPTCFHFTKKGLQHLYLKSFNRYQLVMFVDFISCHSNYSYAVIVNLVSSIYSSNFIILLSPWALVSYWFGIIWLFVANEILSHCYIHESSWLKAESCAF